MKYRYFFVLFIALGSTLLSAQSCDCSITRVNNVTEFSAGCDDPANICSLTLGDNLNSINLEQFTDLRGINVMVGQNVNPTFSGEALVDNGTSFTFANSGTNLVVISQSGQSVTYNSGAGTNPNGTTTLNNQLASCAGTCTLFAPTVLPVVLMDWTTTVSGKAVALNWTTAEEEDNAYFRVSHSRDGLRFEELAQIAGNGTTGNLIDYAFQHTSPARGANYYRLEQIDHDGTTTDLGVQLIDWRGSQAAEDLLAYPNPAVAGQQLQLSAGGEVSLISMTGQVIKTRAATDVVQLPTDLAPGIYLLRVASRTTRLVIQ